MSKPKRPSIVGFSDEEMTTIVVAARVLAPHLRTPFLESVIRQMAVEPLHSASALHKIVVRTQRDFLG